MSADVLVERTGSLGRIRLNRPAALNSLTIGMVVQIGQALDAFEADGGVAAVLVSGEGARGLCAGGDIRELAEVGRGGEEEGGAFLRVEYRLNARIARFPKPYVAFMDGIVMGGGVGVSSHGSHRVVTERTRLAMPECGIGFIPDIGGTRLLALCPGELGTYLGLSGALVGGHDAVLAGFADAFVPALMLETLAEALAAAPPRVDGAGVTALLNGFALPGGPAPLADLGPDIDRLFAFDRVEDILAALDADPSAFAREAAATLRLKSPTSLKVTLALLRQARADPSLEACLEREYAACAQALKGHDLYEGIRAAVIDKDRNPRWVPASLADVSDAALAPYLAPAAFRVFGAGAQG